MTSPDSPSPTGRFLDLRSLEVSTGSLSRASDPHRNASRTRKRRDPNRVFPPPEFIGVDGEGIADEDSATQRYVLLGVGDRQLEDIRGLSFGRIASFLYENFREHPHAVFVGFYLGYDFAHWLKGLPVDRARALFTSEGMASRHRAKSGDNNVPFPVRYAGWEFDLLPGNRRFRLRPQCCGEPWKCSHTGAGWLYICDAGPFFQTSLLNAVNPVTWKDDPIVSPEEYATLIEGKTSRGVAILDASMRRYNALENQVLGRLMERQAAGLAAMGIRLSKDQWFGPGQATQAWLRKHGATRRKDKQSLPYRQFQELARRAYFGGWFEIFMHGRVPGPSYAYDINSAYPHVMSTLPCLLHGHYHHGRGNPPPMGGRDYTICKATVVGQDVYVGAALHRTNAHRILRPQRTRGYLWRHELEAGIRAGVIDHYDVEEWWSYEPCDCPAPLAGLADLYGLRQSVGKDTSLGRAAKIVYNSAYGKFAQSVGAAPFGNWVYASLTTAGCRCIILDAIASHPSGTTDLEMVATDGVFFRTPHPTLPISDALGDWSVSQKEGLFLYKPGFYWDDVSKEAVSFRSRGIRARDFVSQIPGIEDQFLQISQAPLHMPISCTWPSLTFRSGFAIISPLQALRRGKWELAGAVTTDTPLVQSSDPKDKRIPIPYMDRADHWDTPVLRTVPYADGGLSVPYEKTYADDENPFSTVNQEAYGLTPDGTTVMEWNLTTRELTGEE